MRAYPTKPGSLGRVPFGVDGRDDIGFIHDASGQGPEQLGARGHRHQLGDRFSALGYYQRLAMLCDVIEKPEALRLEIACANRGFHRETPMVMTYGHILTRS